MGCVYIPIVFWGGGAWVGLGDEEFGFDMKRRLSGEGEEEMMRMKEDVEYIEMRE